MKLSAWLSALALSAGVFGLGNAAFAQITGTAKLDGKPPEPKMISVAAVPDCAKQHPNGQIQDESIIVNDKGELKNVVVFLSGVKGPVPTDPAVLDQKGCQYVPHVVAVMVGQKLVAKNSDAFLHNVHTMPDDNEPQNLAQPNKDPGTALKSPKVAENYIVKCDVHPWMRAWIVALDNPYFAVTDENGKYSIDTKGLADGTYEIHAWQEKLHEAPVQKVTVKDGKAEVDFTFTPKK